MKTLFDDPTSEPAPELVAGPRITAIAPWFGSKRTLAPIIVTELGRHRAYWEPFCGSMSVFMAKPPCHHEYLNDLHGDLINLARIIQDAKLGPILYRRLRRTWAMEELQVECKAALKVDTPYDLDRAFQYFVESWLGRNGVAGTSSTGACFCIRYATAGGSHAKIFSSTIDSIPAWRRRMRNVAISNRDAFELLANIEDSAATAIYCDPPYIVKGAKYVHDFNPEDHRRLADLLRRFKKTRVVLSYYEHPLLAELYPGWTERSCPTIKGLDKHKRDKKTPTITPEVLLINGPSYAQKWGQP